MRDIKTYLSVAPVLSTVWFGALAGLLIEFIYAQGSLTWERVLHLFQQMWEAARPDSPVSDLDSPLLGAASPQLVLVENGTTGEAFQVASELFLYPFDDAASYSRG